MYSVCVCVSSTHAQYMCRSPRAGTCEGARPAPPRRLYMADQRPWPFESRKGARGTAWLANPLYIEYYIYIYVYTYIYIYVFI